MHPATTRALARIDANIGDFYADRITYEEFTRRARAIWSKIEQRPRLWKAVSAVIAERTRGIPHAA